LRRARVYRFRVHGCDVSFQAAVLLPFGYADEPDRRYRVRDVIAGLDSRLDDLKYHAILQRPRGVGMKIASADPRPWQFVDARNAPAKELQAGDAYGRHPWAARDGGDVAA
jgi:hypothetical protein